ncbi:MAG: diguanylate cyclase [Gallionella sp.]|nr:diguanylate cyclase [Gallionella sp.]
MNWLNRTLTGKFTFLLAGFLALQALQLGVGIYGILHVGEEGAAVSKAARQRMRTYQLLYLAHEALESRSWPSEGRKIMDDVLADYDTESDRLDAQAGKLAKYEKFREAVTVAHTYWDGELKPLLLAFDPSNLQAGAVSLAKFEALVPGHIRHLEEVVRLIEQGIIEDTRDLAKFQAFILGLTLILGVAGFAMARFVVTRPLRRLIEATNAMAAGAYDKRVPAISRDEIGELAKTFNHMAAAVSEKTTRIAVLNEIAVRITSMQSLRDLMDEIMRRGILLTGAQAACIAFYNQMDRRFDEWITQGLSNQFMKNIKSMSIDMAVKTFEFGLSIQCNDRPETEHKLDRLSQEEGIKSLICLPLTSHANRLGVIYFFRKDRDHFLPDETEILVTFAHLAAGAIENARLQEKTLNLAVTDNLTGLRNRRYFDQRLSEEIHHATRLGTPFSLLMLDIDDFKLINDTHGHVAGDRVLQAMGRVLSGQLWQVDIAARYGGEEFAVILPQTDFDAAKSVAERVRKSISKLSVPLPDGDKLGVTVSIGVACYPRCGDTVESLVEHADQALYTAKREGKNRVCLYRQIPKSRLE